MSDEGKKKAPEKVVLQDSPHVKYAIVEIDMAKNRTRILSGLSIWGNIRVFASAIGMSYNKLITEGNDPRLVYKQLESILVQMLQTEYTYEPTKEEKKVYKNGNTKIETTKDGKSKRVKQAIDKSRERSVKAKRTADSKQPTTGNNVKKEKKPSKNKTTKNKGKKSN